MGMSGIKLGVSYSVVAQGYVKSYWRGDGWAMNIGIVANILIKMSKMILTTTMTTMTTVVYFTLSELFLLASAPL